MEDCNYEGAFPDQDSAEWLSESLRRLKWEVECCQKHWEAALAEDDMHGEEVQEHLANLFLHLHSVRNGAVVTQQWIVAGKLIDAAMFAEVGRELAQEQYGIPYEVVAVDMPGGEKVYALRPEVVVVPESLEGMETGEGGGGNA